MMSEESQRCLPRSPVAWVYSGAILGLLFLRYFCVAESAAQGETLWIVALWFLALLAWAIMAWRSKSRAIVVGLWDLSVVLLIGGHIVSALVVLATAGEKRSALNLAWEWCGLFVGWFLLRQECSEPVFRREMFVGLISIGAAVGGLGIYQHYVEFPQMADKYGPLFDQLRGANPVEAARIRQILASEQIPAEGPGLTLFEKRLRDSREPLGLFALANTLGGFLAVCLILATSFAVSLRGISGRFEVTRLFVLVPVIVVLGLCLLLTKSRTAWSGTAMGLVFLSIGLGRVRFRWAQVRGFFIVVILLAIFAWGLVRFGGLDRQVLTEAPKSLQYRLQYWSATLPMIADHPWFGVGPGQFRQYYLLYKKAEASEEISDPHNLFLDAAANGGVTAFFGLFILCVLVVLNFAASRKVKNEDGVPSAASISAPGQRKQASPSGPVLKGSPLPLMGVGRLKIGIRTALLIPSVVSAIAAIGVLGLLFNGFDDRILVLLPISVTLMWVLRWQFAFVDMATIRMGALASAVAILVHLFGAGGIGMPAVCFLLLALVAISDEARQLSVEFHAEGSSRTPLVLRGIKIPSNVVFPSSLGVGLLSLAMLFLLVSTSLRPNALVQEKTREGDRLVQRGKNELADVEYLAAAAADGFSPEPWRARAELAYRKAVADRFRSNELFLNAVGLLRKASARDPMNFRDIWRLGDWWRAKWRLTGQAQDAEAAVGAYQQASKRYPTNALLMADLVFALEANGNASGARTTAEKVLQQDQLNHERGHQDRYLADSVRVKLKELLVRQKE